MLRCTEEVPPIAEFGCLAWVHGIALPVLLDRLGVGPSPPRKALAALAHEPGAWVADELTDGWVLLAAVCFCWELDDLSRLRGGRAVVLSWTMRADLQLIDDGVVRARVPDLMFQERDHVHLRSELAVGDLGSVSGLFEALAAGDRWEDAVLPWVAKYTGVDTPLAWFDAPHPAWMPGS